jgi:hypothetical protein
MVEGLFYFKLLSGEIKINTMNKIISKFRIYT